MMKDDSFALDVYEGAPHTGKVSFDLPSTGLSSTFLWLWGGQTVSLVGSQISALSFQVVAVTVLHASPMQMGVVTASQTIPYLLFGLFVGVLVDRVSRRRLLIGADLARLGILFTAATLAASHHLGVPLLCAIVCAISTINLIFDAALGAYIPELLDRRQWLRANSRLSVSMSGSEVAGPGVAGYILQVLSAAGAMVTDAVSYLISAVCILCAKPAKQAVVKKSSQWDRETSWGLSSNVLHSVREGVGFVFTHPILRIFALWSAVWNFSWSAVLAVLVLYATQTLKLPPRSIGMVLAIGGIGGVAGAACASRLAGLLSQGVSSSLPLL
jgi:predicted MFS family arabinose efflux permease